MPFEKETPTELLVNTQSNQSIDDVLSALPEYSRDEIREMIESLLIAELRGDYKLKSNQLSALNSLSRKFLDNPPTIKEEEDPIDFLALLNEAYKNNASAFTDLSVLALSFREQENKHRDSLEKAKLEIEEQDQLGQHIPNLSGLDDLGKQLENDANNFPHTFTQNKKDVSQGIDPESAENNRFDEMVGLQSDGVPSAWPTDFIQHEPG